MCETIPSATVVFFKTISDALTSSGSSFPFSAEECARYTKMIKPYRSEPMNDQILCIVARLNSSIGTFTIFFLGIRLTNGSLTQIVT